MSCALSLCRLLCAEEREERWRANEGGGGRVQPSSSSSLARPASSPSSLSALIASSQRPTQADVCTADQDRHPRRTCLALCSGLRLGWIGKLTGPGLPSSPSLPGKLSPFKRSVDTSTTIGSALPLSSPRNCSSISDLRCDREQASVLHNGQDGLEGQFHPATPSTSYSN